MTQTERLKNKALGFLEEAEQIQALADAEGRGMTHAERVEVETLLDNFDEVGASRQTAERLAALRGLRPRKTDSEPVGARGITSDGFSVPILARGERLAAMYPRSGSEAPFSLGNYVKTAMGLGPQGAVVSTSAVVPSYVSANIIDAVRAISTVVQAGAVTVPIGGPTNLCRIATDPTVYQHEEGEGDISESDAVFQPVALNPWALVGAVPLSHEVVEDSPNLDAALNMSLAQAFAAKLDALSLATILADTAIPTSSAGQDPASWAGVLAAVGQALGADQTLPSAFIGSEGDFIARASQLASTAGSWLGKPPVLAGMLELPTTKMSDGTAVFGDFARGLGVAVRQELRLEVVRFHKHLSYSHVLMAHARMDGVVLQPKRLFIQLETVT